MDKFDGIGGSTDDRALVLDFTGPLIAVLFPSPAVGPHEEINIHITYLLNVRVQRMFRLATADSFFL